MEDRFLSSDDIVTMAPRSLIMQVIKGVMVEHSLSISVMFDKDEDDAELSRGTGKVFITDVSLKGQAEYCALFRAWPDKVVNKRCDICDRTHFDSVRKKVLANPSYRGEIYRCSAGGLWDFVVPIVEKESNAFIGVIFGGQKRPKESYLEAWKYLRDFIARQDNRCLASIPFWKLYWNYLKVGQVTEEELRGMKSKCERIGDELAKPFELLVQIRKAKLEKETEQEAVTKIDDLLIGARNLKAFCGSMGMILTELQKWLPFDWGMVLVSKESRTGEAVFEVRSVAGRGIESRDIVQGRQLVFPSDEVKEVKETRHNPEFLRRDVCSMVPGQPECWWIPLIAIDDSILGAIVLGSAPEHRNTQYNGQHIIERIHRLEEIARKMATKYIGLNALESAERKTIELKQSQEKLEKTVGSLEDTLRGLTHVTGRPLVMMQGALSNVRDLYERGPRPQLTEHIELGILVAKHAELLTGGIKKILAPYMSSEFKDNPVLIDAKAKLEELSKAMQRLSNRKDISFQYFDESPVIEMDLDSFLYVFYVLIDNAIKYSDPGRTIELVCDEERDTSNYALKVKSFGLLIDDPSIVFRKFQRGREAWRYDDTGIGLGCWSAKGHMLRQGGDITLETKGKLSVFIVHLPTPRRRFYSRGA